MREKIKDRQIVIVNQAANYLTVGLCNAFSEQFETVDLVTGHIHEQGEPMNKNVRVTYINRFTRQSRSKKYIGYLAATLRIYFLLLTRFRKYEVFFMSTPPMAYLLTVFIPHKTAILIWDVYPDTFKITGIKESHPLFKAWFYLNKKTFKKAFKLFTIGQRMADLLSKYVEREKIEVTPIWSIFQTNGKVTKQDNPFAIEHDLQGKFVVQYSGNIGLTHNVEVLVEIADKMKDRKDIVFQIIGKGDRLPVLKKIAKDRKLDNCHFLPFQPDHLFQYSLSAADLGVVILDELTSKGSVPSKSYNLMSFGIPSLYIAADDSELCDYTKKYQHGECFRSGEKELITDFITEVAGNPKLHKEYSTNALFAAQNYRRSNADEIINLYLSENGYFKNEEFSLLKY